MGTLGKVHTNGQHFDNFYHEIVSLAKQLNGNRPELIFRKLKLATNFEVRYKAFEKAAELNEDEYEKLAHLYTLADEAVRELAKEKKADTPSDKQKGGGGHCEGTGRRSKGNNGMATTAGLGVPRSLLQSLQNRGKGGL